MKRTWLRGVCPAVALALLPGCQRAADYAAIVREQLAAQKEMTQILSTVQDAESMKKAGAELRKRLQRFDEIRQKARSLSNPSPEIRAQLQDEFGYELQRIPAELIREAERVRELPGGKEFITRFRFLR